MRMSYRWIALVPAIGPAIAHAQAANPFEQGQDQTYAVEEELLQQKSAQLAKIYGFIEGRFEKSAAVPYDAYDQANGKPGSTVSEKQPYEWSVPALHLMVQGAVAERFKYFLNLAGPKSGNAEKDTPIAVRNAWMEAAIVEEYLNVRVGKTYRRFGLYNEILDAVPTFIGIEPPELFDTDHLLLTRTTNFMAHGQVASGDATFGYALMTGNDERAVDEIPLGADLFFDYQGLIRVGTSFYTTNGDSAPTIGVGSGSPKGGTVDWMAKDSFQVFGGYAQLHLDALLFEAEYWRAPHDGQRDPAAMAEVCATAVNADQWAHFHCAEAANLASEDDAKRAKAEQILGAKASYSVQTAYVRAGYAIDTDAVEVTPYAQYDYYSNPEIVREKDVGGDDEAGLADDGTFSKFTLGVILRPDPAVALKVDGSAHMQSINRKTEIYPELRVSLSYSWQLGGL